MQNIFVLFNVLMLRGTYNKSSKQDQNIVWIPLLQFGRLIIRILASKEYINFVKTVNAGEI